MSVRRARRHAQKLPAANKLRAVAALVLCNLLLVHVLEEPLALPIDECNVTDIGLAGGGGGGLRFSMGRLRALCAAVGRLAEQLRALKYCRRDEQLAARGELCGGGLQSRERRRFIGSWWRSGGFVGNCEERV